MAPGPSDALFKAPAAAGRGSGRPELALLRVTPPARPRLKPRPWSPAPRRGRSEMLPKFEPASLQTQTSSISHRPVPSWGHPATLGKINQKPRPHGPHQGPRDRRRPAPTRGQKRWERVRAAGTHPRRAAPTAHPGGARGSGGDEPAPSHPGSAGATATCGSKP